MQNKVRGSVAPGAKPNVKYQHDDDPALALRAAMYELLVSIHTEEADYGGALQLLNRAITDTSHTRHQLPLLKDRIFLKARLGESIELDMETLKDTNQQLTCYQRAISSLTSTETWWCKADILLEFGRWLYFHNFPREEAQQQIQCAVDILLTQEPAEAADSGSVAETSLPTEKHASLLGGHGSFTRSVSGLKEVCRLDLLVQAHVLLAVNSDKSSQEHQLNLLRAHTFILQIWQVLTSAACPVSDEMAKSRPPQTPVSDTRSKKKKVKNLTPAEDKAAVLDQTFPSTVKDWTQYVCPDPVRQVFRTSNSISKQTQSLFYLTLLEEELLALSLHHLTLPVLHLAETIAHDILERRSLSDIYRLKIVRTCLQLGLDSSSPYKEKLLDLSRIQEEEQMLVNSAGGHLFMSYRHFRAQLLLSETRSSLYKGLNLNADLRKDACVWGHWVEKAELCLSLGLHQSACQHLAEALQAALEFGDTVTASRSLLGLAALACEEQNHQLALNLLDEAQSHGVLFNLCPPFRIINQMDMCIVDRPDGLDPPRRIINGVLLSVQMSMIPHVIG
uniref:Tetratricopeptide repeat domain 40 n=1 Tax=Nothobranchius kuhntae TaxID=321403 RepID=A0A1A8IQ59_NOTKU